MQVAVDPWTRRLRPSIVFGGHPPRFLRLGEAGVAALDEIESGRAQTGAAVDLAERMIDAGMAYRRPVPAGRAEVATVSVVIPVYDRAEEVAELVTGLERSLPLVHEIIVVDDASPDPSARRLAECLASTSRTRLIRHESNLGPAAARNSGIAAATTSRVLFVDSDCLVPDGSEWLETLLGHLNADAVVGQPRVAAVAPRIVSAATSIAHRATTLSLRYDRAFCPLDMGALAGLVGPSRRVRYVPTAALLVDLDIARDPGSPKGPLFDASLRVGEDVDLVWRLVGRGLRVVYEPTVRICHREPGSLRALARRRLQYGSSAAELDGRHRGAVSHLAVSPLAAIACFGAIGGRATPIAAAYAIEVATLGRQLRRASLPRDQLARAVGASGLQSALGIGRYLNQFWWPIVLAIIVNRRVARGVRVRLALVCVGRSIQEGWRLDGSIAERVGLVAARTVDEAVYGTGVWRGALARRRLGVVLPRVGRWAPKVGSRGDG